MTSEPGTLRDRYEATQKLSCLLDTATTTPAWGSRHDLTVRDLSTL
ncbi:hypothetical protein [Coleofasciculus sp. FACHB-1120]|nr:hypothetical protein [Coleofasciculus sp. FACHB-1120]MBD2743601.1 hypothetical protein [Coleofasciculus sp. FACHB-1120]